MMTHRDLIRWSFALLAWSALSSLALAQPERGPRGRGMGGGFDLVPLALNESVTAELKLTPDQITKLKELGPAERGRGRGATAEERMKERAEAAEGREKKIAAILQPEQLSRLKQIGLQVQGPRAFGSQQVASALALTPEQTTSIAEIQGGMMTDMRKLFESGALKEGDSDEIKAANRAQIAKVDKAALDKIIALLTPEQTAKWKELIGEPFSGNIDMSEMGRGRRRGRD
jgi:hypothetical protein